MSQADADDLYERARAAALTDDDELAHRAGAAERSGRRVLLWDAPAAAPAGCTGVPAVTVGDATHEAYRTVQQFVHWLDICHCGDGPAVVLVPLREALLRFGDDGSAVLGQPVDHWSYLLDVWSLTNHGGSVHTAWLTPAGERLREALRLVDLAAYAAMTGEEPGTWWRREAELRPAGATLSYGTWEVGGDR